MARKVRVPLGQSRIILYAGPRIADAAREFLREATLYEGVKRVDLLWAVYKQGKKDGAREAFAAIAKGMRRAERMIPHRNLGTRKKPR